VKGNRSRTRHLALALFVVVAAPPIIWWVVFHQSSAIVPVHTKSNSDAAPLPRAHTRVPATALHFIAMQAPGAVLRQGGDGMEMQTMVANCAKGFVRRGSVCEVDPTQTLSAASQPDRQSPIRPPIRE
jgi:hypothetical protein